VLARAGRALVNDRPAHGFEQGPNAVERAHVPADHDCERGILRADVAARDRRVESGGPPRSSGLRDLDRERRLGRGHVHKHRVPTDAGQQAILREVNGPDVCGKPEHREDDIALPGCRAGRIGPHGAAIEERLRLLARAGEDGDTRATGEQVPAHGASHDAGADPGNAEGREVAHATDDSA
jgi:hypothetical protein